MSSKQHERFCYYFYAVQIINIKFKIQNVNILYLTVFKSSAFIGAGDSYDRRW